MAARGWLVATIPRRAWTVDRRESNFMGYISSSQSSATQEDRLPGVHKSSRMFAKWVYDTRAREAVLRSDPSPYSVRMQGEGKAEVRGQNTPKLDCEAIYETLASQGSRISGGPTKFAMIVEMEPPRPWRLDTERRVFQEAMQQTILAEEMGFDYVWCATR